VLEEAGEDVSRGFIGAEFALLVTPGEGEEERTGLWDDATRAPISAN